MTVRAGQLEHADRLRQAAGLLLPGSGVHVLQRSALWPLLLTKALIPPSQTLSNANTKNPPRPPSRTDILRLFSFIEASPSIIHQCM
ncbi:hypothetical protein [Massilia violaceinigra]|uniref:hypothetical protein n=1 Tax=Massilia violaceinigra TaxID=2045208 RepID=UPI0012FDCCF9|nr:hypothetical protein [Massilia violaceinigra]